MKTWALLAVSLVLVVGSFAQERSDAQWGRTILVTGNGEAMGAPDQAVLRLGATVQTGQANTSQAQVNEIVKKALEAIEKVGIPKKSIRTSGLTLHPVYSQNERMINPSPEGPKVTAYRANNTIEVTLEDLKLAGKVIDAGVAAGANELQGIAFGLQNDTEQRAEALTKAAQEARAKAETIAKALDLKLGRVVEVTESGVSVMPMQENFRMARMMAASPGMQTPVEPGEVRVQANVSVRYEIGNGVR